MLVPPWPLADCHCSRTAHPSETRVISLVPTGTPVGLVTFQWPSQKSNWRNSGDTQAGGGGVAVGVGDGLALTAPTIARRTAVRSLANMASFLVVLIDLRKGNSEGRLARFVGQPLRLPIQS